MSRSGWCPPWPHAAAHTACQARLDDGRLTSCDCPNHSTPTTTQKAA